MIICISSLMSRSMAWVTIETASEIRWCGCRWTVCEWYLAVAAAVRAPMMYILNAIFVKLPTTIYYCECQTKPKQQMKRKNAHTHTHTLSQNVTSTGMISIEIYGPRDLFIFFSSLPSFLCLFMAARLVRVDFTLVSNTLTLVLFKFVYNIMFHWIDFYLSLSLSLFGAGASQITSVDGDGALFYEHK